MKKAPWCSGNILAFGANVGGSNPPGAVIHQTFIALHIGSSLNLL
jgi:hypothetical protein